jgi:hypothetical protein
MSGKHRLSSRIHLFVTNSSSSVWVENNKCVRYYRDISKELFQNTCRYTLFYLSPSLTQKLKLERKIFRIVCQFMIMIMIIINSFEKRLIWNAHNYLIHFFLSLFSHHSQALSQLQETNKAQLKFIEETDFDFAFDKSNWDVNYSLTSQH